MNSPSIRESPNVVGPDRKNYKSSFEHGVSIESSGATWRQIGLVLSLAVGLGLGTNPAIGFVTFGDLLWQLSLVAVPLWALLKLRGTNWPYKRNGLVLLLSLPALYLLSTLWSEDAGATLFGSVRLFAATAWAISIVYVTGARLWRLLAVALFLSLSTSLVTSVVTLDAYDFGGGGYRGAMSQKNSLGSLAAFALLVALLAPHLNRSSRAVLAATAITTLVMADSVTAYFGATAGLLIAAVFYIRRASLYWASACVFGLSFCALLFYASGALGLALADFGKNLTLTGRTGIWAAVEQYISLRPTLGYGYDAFWDWRSLSVALDPINPGLDSAHNLYLEVLLAVGLVGLAVLVAVVLGAIRLALSSARDQTRPLLCAALSLCMVQSLAESSIFAPRAFGLLLLTILALKPIYPTGRS